MSARSLIVLVVVVFLTTGVLAWWRVGLLDLPRVSSKVTFQSSGLGQLTEMTTLDQFVRSDSGIARSGSLASAAQRSGQSSFAAQLAHDGIAAVRSGNEPSGLDTMRTAVREEPTNLVLANVYRMEVFRLRRAFLREAKQRGELSPHFPPHLDRQPIAFFEELVREHPSREAKLSLALSWVDEMLLFPALEIKAPSSVQAVDILTELLSSPDNAAYVPALFARGLNHVHRPARLVWPESNRTEKDAAAKDIAKCVAIGRKLKVGSDRLHATLSMTLGDAYLKAGRFGVARSWWQIAQNLCRDEDLQQAVRRRYAWRDEEMLDRLEEELDRSRSELEHPMTDLAMMWN